MAEWKMLCLPSVLLLWPQIFTTTLQEHGHPGFACLTTTDTKVPVRNLRSYTRQYKPVVPVDAVRFLTIKGNTICSDPSSAWAVKAMKHLDEKKKHQSASTRRSVTAAPNTMSTINTKSAQRSTTQIRSTPDTKQKTGNETEFPTARTTLEPDWRGSTETTETWEEEEEDAVTGSACLNTTDTKVPVRNLCSFSIQCKPVFPVDAVRFLTVKGNTICSDPSSAWAVKAMKHLDEKKKHQSASSTDHQFVTTAPKNTSTTNAKSAQSSTIQICSPPENYTQSLRDIIKHRTQSKTEFPTARTTLEPDWRGSTETTETFQLEEEESNIMNEPFIDRFCLKGEQVKHSDP